jgi:deoxyribonuclease-4
MCQLHHVTNIITSLEYGVLKKNKVVPNKTMFTQIPKLGGDFPKLARKVDSWWFGYLMDRIVRMILQEKCFKSSILEASRKEVSEHTNEEQCNREEVEEEEKYYEDISKWLLDVTSDISSDDWEFEPEWEYDHIVAHPDLVIGDTIYDVKTTGRWGKMRIMTILQLLSYASIAKCQGKIIKYIGVILPAQKIIEKYDISKWDGSFFLDILNQKAHQKEDLGEINEEILEKFEEVKPFIGSHVTRCFTLRKTLETLSIEKPIQIFLCGRMKLHHKLTSADFSKSLCYIQENNMNVFVHAPYIINISREYFKKKSSEQKALEINDSMIYHLEETAKFGGKGVVFHIGRQADMSYDEAMDNMTTNISLAAAFATPDCPLLIETDAGGSLIDNPRDLADFWLGLDDSIRDNTAICLDTCHVFAAGYDNMEILDMFEKKNVPIKLIHYNDSKFEQGTKKDRHAKPGYGLIGYSKLIDVAQYAIEKDIPMVHE